MYDPWSRIGWHPHHPVLQLLRRRRDERSRPGGRADHDLDRVALVVEGGGMRGVRTAAMLCAIDDLDLKDSFDLVIGCSSGAMNAAYFLAGPTWYPLSIYWDDLATRQFVDFRRPLRGRPIMDLSWAFDEVVERRKPLPWEGVVHSPLPLAVVVADVDELRPTLLTDFTDRHDLRAALTASCWLPLAVLGTATARGRRVVDGGVLAPYLETTALELPSINHVLSLHTRPLAERQAVPGWGHRPMSAYLDRLRPGLGRAWITSLGRPIPEPTQYPHWLAVGSLPDEPSLSRHEINPNRLIKAARRSFGAMWSLLAGRQIDEVKGGGPEVAVRLTLRSTDIASTPVGSRSAG